MSVLHILLSEFKIAFKIVDHVKNITVFDKIFEVEWFQSITLSSETFKIYFQSD